MSSISILWSIFWRFISSTPLISWSIGLIEGEDEEADEQEDDADDAGIMLVALNSIAFMHMDVAVGAGAVAAAVAAIALVAITEPDASPPYALSIWTFPSTINRLVHIVVESVVLLVDGNLH